MKIKNITNYKKKLKHFLKKHISPNVKKWDEKQFFPVKIFKKFSKLGFMGALIPKKLGGLEMSYFEYVKLIEELAKVDPSISLSLSAHNSLCVNHIYLFCNDLQKKKWIPLLISKGNIGAWAFTELSTGSDSKNMKTTAFFKNNKWIINGKKKFITHAFNSDVIILTALTGEKGNSNSLSSFIMKKNTPGIFNGEKINKLGMRASETGEIIFKNCCIPDEQRIGNIGDGLFQAMKILEGGRISIAALSLGISKYAFKIALNYSKKKKRFGKFISEFQAISFKLAEMATKIEISKLLIKKACEKQEKGVSVKKESAMCKYYASEACVKITNEAIQILGGDGYTNNYPVEKLYRDAKLCTIGEGTTEIQKLIIAKNIIN